MGDAAGGIPADALLRRDHAIVIAPLAWRRCGREMVHRVGASILAAIVVGRRGERERGALNRRGTKRGRIGRVGGVPERGSL
jgi:hypothetical protein